MSDGMCDMHRDKAMPANEGRQWSAKHGWRYAHMCRMDHEQIGHNVSDEDERCPLCRKIDEASHLRTVIAGLDGLVRDALGFAPDVVGTERISAHRKELMRDV